LGKTARRGKQVLLFRGEKLVLAAIMLIALSAVFAATAFSQPPRSEATLVVLDGQATVTHGSRRLLVFPSSTQVVARAGEAVTVVSGDVISLDAASTARLAFLGGTTVELYEGTELVVTELQTTAVSYRIRLQMIAGRTLNQVKRLIGADTHYEVLTPSSAVSVRGTVFSVEVIDANTSLVMCSEGQVAVSADDQQVDVGAGQQVRTVRGQPLMVEPQQGSSLQPAAGGGMAADPAIAPTSMPTPLVVEVAQPATPTPAPSRPATRPQNPAPTPTAMPGNTIIRVFPVYYCQYIGGGTFKWFEVEVTFVDNVPVSEKTLSGPYNGPWQSGCPSVPADGATSTPEDDGGGMNCLIDLSC
jgi:mannose-6-phosphate isomerase-like protein (cupin superfamily)